MHVCEYLNTIAIYRLQMYGVLFKPTCILNWNISNSLILNNIQRNYKINHQTIHKVDNTNFL